jgi:carboxyl-terminal processing protease
MAYTSQVLKFIRKRGAATHFAAFLAGVVVATAVAAHAVPDPAARSNRERFAALDSFAQSLGYISNYYVDSVDERSLLYGGINGMVSQLDPHSAFFTPAQYRRLRQDTEGEFGGVGIKLGAGEKGVMNPVIEEIVAGSPASKAGLNVGDILVEVNGKPTASRGKSVRSARSWHTALRGVVGSRIKLVLARSSWSKPRTFELTRRRIVVPSVELKMLGTIAWVRVRRFQEATTRDLQRSLRRSKASAVVLDLRGNPGGLLDQGIFVADLFLSEGKIVSVVSRAGSDLEVHRAHGPGTLSSLPMVVLVDENTASAAEIVAAALQDHGRATVVGVPTYGKGTVQTFLDLGDGSGLKLTTSRYLTPKGASVEDTGIQPDKLVESFEGETITAGGAPSAAKNRPRPPAGLAPAAAAVLSEDPQLLASFQLLAKSSARQKSP